MKSFKLVAYQKEAMIVTEFKLSEKDAPNHGKIVGTAINDLFRKLDAAKIAKARIFDGRQPINIRLENEQTGKNVDSKLMDIGIKAYKSSYTQKLKLNSSAGSRAQFAKNVWTYYNVLREKMQVKNIDAVIEERVQEHENILAARKLVLLPNRANKIDVPLNEVHEEAILIAEEEKSGLQVLAEQVLDNVPELEVKNEVEQPA